MGTSLSAPLTPEQAAALGYRLPGIVAKIHTGLTADIAALTASAAVSAAALARPATTMTIMLKRSMSCANTARNMSRPRKLSSRR